MRRSTLIATTAAGAVLAAGLLAAPALASGRGPGGGFGDTFTTTTPATENGFGTRNGNGYGYGTRNGNGAAPGAGVNRGVTAADPLAGLEKGTLSAEQQSALAGMAEEEKLAHDVYVALAGTSGDARFTRIAASEAQHVTEVRALLTRYGIADPTADKAEGSFATPAVQALYDSLVARGDDSAAAALAVGRDIENLDISDLAKAGAGVTAPDVRAVYERLSNGSENHLRAFSR